MQWLFEQYWTLCNWIAEKMSTEKSDYALITVYLAMVAFPSIATVLLLLFAVSVPGLSYLVAIATWLVAQVVIIYGVQWWLSKDED